MHMMYGYGSFWSMILMIICWSGLISLGIYLITNFINGGNKKSSLQIIKKRLATDEVDETAYLRLKSIIERARKGLFNSIHSFFDVVNYMVCFSTIKC